MTTGIPDPAAEFVANGMGNVFGRAHYRRTGCYPANPDHGPDALQKLRTSRSGLIATFCRQGIVLLAILNGSMSLPQRGLRGRTR